MKRIFILLALIIGIVSINAQTVVTEVAPDGYITKPSYVYVFGSTTDTLTNADTVTSVIRVLGVDAYDINIKAYSDHISGTAGGTLILTQSIDGITYQTESGDTITLSGVTTDTMDSEVISKLGFLYPYCKVQWIQTGTAVIVPKVYIYAKNN